MSSLIANKVKTNLCLISIKLFILRTIICATVQTYTTYFTITATTTTRSLFLSTYNIFAIMLVRYYAHTTVRYSAHNLFVSTNTYSLHLYCEELQTTT